MITVKGTKSAEPGSDPAGRYRLAEKPASGTPFGIGMVLIGIGFYLRDLFPSWGIQRPEEEPQPADSEDRPDAPTIVADGGERPSPEPGNEATDPVPASSGKLEPVSRLTGLNALSPAPESAAIPGLSIGGGFEPRSSAAQGISSRAANDNVAPPGAPKPNLSRATGDVDSASPGRRDDDDDRGGDADNDDRGGDDAGGGGDGEGDPDSVDESDDDEAERSNRAPVVSGPIQLYDAFGCTAILIGLADLLRHASDPDGDALSVRNLTVSSGTLTQAGEGWLYDPSSMGDIVFTYEITDGSLAALQTAHLTVRAAPPILGTDGDDIIVGVGCADRIDGGPGDDIVDARGGADVVEGGAGRDHIVAGDGDDTVVGGAGDDIIFGGRGDDRVWGGDGSDRLFGEEGEDVLHGETGDDLVFGGDGDDLAFGGSGGDAIHGEAGDDVIDGEAGDDRLTGGDGDDTVLGGDGSDLIEGGAGRDLVGGGQDADVVGGGGGDDVVIGDADRADDVYDGGEGLDALDYSAATCAIEADMAAATAAGFDIGRDTATNFEILVSGTGDDRIVDGGSIGVIRSAGGDDSVAAAADGRDDIYDGGAGCDIIDYRAAIDAVVADLGGGTVAGNDIGSDRIRNFEGFLAGAGDDTIWGGDAGETIHGMGGDDAIDAGAGDDIVRDGAGADTVAAGEGDDSVEACADGGDDAYDGGTGTDTLSYAATAAGVTVDLQSKAVTGVEVGRDTIDGFEKIVGGSGGDTFVAHGGPVSFHGGKGDDLFDFSQLDGAELAGQVAYEILDFVVGDRIRVSRYEIFEEVVDTLEDRFEDVYGDDLDDDDMPIRIRHERTDEMRRTYVEADMDRNDHYELSITLHGHHLLMMVEQA